MQTLTGHEGSVMALLETGDGGVLSLGLDGSIKVTDQHIKNGRQLLESGYGTEAEEDGLSHCVLCCVVWCVV